MVSSNPVPTPRRDAGGAVHEATIKEISAFIDALYGAPCREEMIFGRASSRLLHVTSVWSQTPTQQHVMRICAETPRSDHDLFALNLCRARADAIVITGRILREEPDLRYELPPGLLRWRREVLHKTSPPILAILSSRAPDLDHAALRGWASPLLFGAAATAEASPSRLPAVPLRHPSLRATIQHLRDRMGCKTISVETGPRTALTLYDPLQIDELLLSCYLGGAIPHDLNAGAFLGMPQLHALFDADETLTHDRSTRVDETSGRWIFHRFRSASLPPLPPLPPSRLPGVPGTPSGTPS